MDEWRRVYTHDSTGCDLEVRGDQLDGFDLREQKDRLRCSRYYEFRREAQAVLPDGGRAVTWVRAIVIYPEIRVVCPHGARIKNGAVAGDTVYFTLIGWNAPAVFFEELCHSLGTIEYKDQTKLERMVLPYLCHREIHTAYRRTRYYLPSSPEAQWSVVRKITFNDRRCLACHDTPPEPCHCLQEGDPQWIEWLPALKTRSALLTGATSLT